MTSTDITRQELARDESDLANANPQGPRTGQCAKCSQRRPLFPFEIVTAEFHAIESRTVWLCTRDWSTAKGMDEREADAEDWGYWLPRRPKGWDPFGEPVKPVTVRDIAGIAPDWTGGKSTEQFIREQRDRA
jgi:hypothetical protein